MKILKKILAASAALLIITASGCVKKDKDKKSSIKYYDNSNEYTQNAEGIDYAHGETAMEDMDVKDIPTIPVKINEKAEISGVDIKLTNVYNAGVIEPVYNPDQKRQVIALDCEITNNNNYTISVNSFDFLIQYVDGVPMQIETGMNELIMANRNITSSKALNTRLDPGDSTTGFAALSVEEGWESFTVYFRPVKAEKSDAIAIEVTKDMVEEP